MHDVLRSPGQPLDTATRAFMEPRFGHDFSRIRIHADRSASRSAEAVAARAYTVSEDIAFKQGEYAPHTPEGRLLLAHELAHVVQQRPARAPPAATPTPPATPAPALHRSPDPDAVLRRSPDPDADQPSGSSSLAMRPRPVRLGFGLPPLRMFHLTLPPLGQGVKPLAVSPSLDVPPLTLQGSNRTDLASAARDAARGVVGEPAPAAPAGVPVKQRLDSMLALPPDLSPIKPERPSADRSGPHREAGFQADEASFQFSATFKDFNLGKEIAKTLHTDEENARRESEESDELKTKRVTVEGGVLEPQVAVSSKPIVPGSLTVSPPLPNQLQASFNAFDLHVLKAGEDLLEITLAPLLLTSFPTSRPSASGRRCRPSCTSPSSSRSTPSRR